MKKEAVRIDTGKLDPRLIKRIEAAAKAKGLTRAAWIDNAILLALEEQEGGESSSWLKRELRERLKGLI